MCRPGSSKQAAWMGGVTIIIGLGLADSDMGDMGDMGDSDIGDGES